MSENKSFGNTLDNWMNKAEEFLDGLKDKSTGYGKQLTDVISKLDDAARADKHDVSREMREAKKGIRQQYEEFSDRLDRWVDQIQQRAKQSGDITTEQLERFKQKAENLKKDMKAEAYNFENEVERRSDKFSDGVDRIIDDLKQNAAAGGREVTGTSSADGAGNYEAADLHGTPHNYFDRMEEHTENTKDRIREGVEEAEETFREKLDELTRKY
ncbi:MAG: apolipoprotein A1/A4/E family protein [Alistipes sp.]|nr:apolipoprotein A1/A4/E family protein [Alistipes sp.]